LLKGQKAVDVALVFGYETASGFAKAFRREFGCSPTQYKKNSQSLNGPNSKPFKNRQTMKVRVEERAGFKIAGFAVETRISEASMTEDLVAFWDVVDMEGWETRLYDQLNPLKHGEFGIFTSKGSDAATYTLGVKVEDFQLAQPEMNCIEVPAATYAVFTTPVVDAVANPDDFAESIRYTWKAIFNEWFTDSGYEYDQSKLDFEFYDERCHNRQDSVMEIWIPIKKTGEY
jgi:AraC family transcriptional regulator